MLLTADTGEIINAKQLPLKECKENAHLHVFFFNTAAFYNINNKQVHCFY